MKPWLARTLLAGAIALALLAGLWMVLDWKGSHALEEARARWDAQGWSNSEEALLPPLDSAEDAGPLYLEACKAFERWQHVDHRPPPKHIEVVELQGFQPEDHPPVDDPHPAFLDAPEFAHIEELMREAARRSQCRLWIREKRSFPPDVLSDLARLSSQFLLPAARHGAEADAWARIDCVLALSAHLREDPLIVSLLVSRSLASQSLEELRQTLARLPLGADPARSLLASVQRLHPELDILRAFNGEFVLYGQPAWDAIVEGRMPGGNGMPEDLLASTKLKFLRPWRLLDEARYLEVREAQSAAIVANPWAVPPAVEISAAFPFTRLLTDSIAKLFGPWVLDERRTRDLAEIALRLAIARAESGRYPDELSELGAHPIEPATKQAYVYTRSGEGYTLALPSGLRDGATLPAWTVPR